MSDDKGVEKEGKEEIISKADVTKKKRKGILSRIWNVIFRSRGDDLEKRLEYISKEEALEIGRAHV